MPVKVNIIDNDITAINFIQNDDLNGFKDKEAQLLHLKELDSLIYVLADNSKKVYISFLTNINLS